MSEWIEHDGKGMPIDGETTVEVQFRDGGSARSETAFNWTPDGEDPRNYWVFSEDRPQDDIVRYRVCGA